MADKAEILAALSTIIDPDFQKDIVSLGFIKDLAIDGGHVSFAVELTTPACPIKDQFKEQAEQRVKALPGVDAVAVTMTARERPKRELQDGSGLKDVKNILAVSSCKGGVGKSTVAAMLATTLRDRGHAVGLLDADIFGPSVPTLFNEHDAGVMQTPQQYLVPRDAKGLKLMSFGFLSGDNPAVMRGPMVSNFMQQLLHQVAWGELDYLIIDMPPGTGDIQLTISQSTQIDAAVIVTTPHQLSLTDVRKGILMFEKVNVPVVGVVENMAYFVCDGCDKRHTIFGEPGGETLEERFGLKTLAQLPVVSVMSDQLSGILDTPYAGETTDAVIRALGEQSLKKVSRPEVDYDDTSITLKWETGEQTIVANRDLRLACSCALCVDEMSNKPVLDPATVPMDIHAKEVRIVGNYALGITWSDDHATGFFPYKSIRRVAEAGAQG